jgi:hypothetical protein
VLIDDEYNVQGELAQPFDTLLGDDLRRAAAVRASEELQDAVEETLRRREAKGARPERSTPTRARTAPRGHGTTTPF